MKNFLNVLKKSFYAIFSHLDVLKSRFFLIPRIRKKINQRTRSDLEKSRTNSTLTSLKSRLETKTNGLCVPKLVPKKATLEHSWPLRILYLAHRPSNNKIKEKHKNWNYIVVQNFPLVKNCYCFTVLELFFDKFNMSRNYSDAFSTF